MDERIETTKDKKGLAIQVYRAVRDRGWDFPQKISSMAVILMDSGIDWRKLGYTKMLRLFEDLSDYFTVHAVSQTEKLIDYTQGLKTAVEEGGEASGEQNMIVRYFADGIREKRTWKKEFTGEIYCFHNWDKTTVMLTKMTGVYDLSPEGWLDILSFSYHLASGRGQVMKNLSGNYLCFDTGLPAVYGDKIYLLAGKNACETPRWMLLGLTTVYSRFLGGILKSEFHLS